MKRLIPIPPETATSLKREEETGLGYQIVSVVLKDGTRFEQAVASEGCIAVRGFTEVPFEISEVATVTVNHRRWNFRKCPTFADPRRARLLPHNAYSNACGTGRLP
jgi:hypothetical protein